MTDATTMMAAASAGVVGLSITSAAGLKAWSGWLDVKRLTIGYAAAASNASGIPDATPGGGATFVTGAAVTDIVVEALSNNWDEKMAEVMWALKFRPTTDPQPVLVAEGIDEARTRDMHGWLVKGWKVATGRDAYGDKVHQDLIEWTKTVNGQTLEITSIFSWRPYAPLQESRSLVELSPALQLDDRRRARTLVLI